MIGLALVSTFTVMGSSMKESFRQAIEQSFGADYVLGTEQFMPISTDLAARVARSTASSRSAPSGGASRSSARATARTGSPPSSPRCSTP
jgi:hypothetical protein